jgi:hypothetical protein
MIIAWLIVAYVIGLGLVLTGAYQVAPIDAQGFAKFRDVATVMVAAYTALMTGVISLFSLWKNQAAAKELEQLKRSLQVDLLTEQLARNLELETTKSRLVAKDSAYLNLYRAADAAYDTLNQNLNREGWTSEKRKVMEERLSAASSDTAQLSNQEHVLKWELARQRAMDIALQAQKLTGPKKQKQFWQSELNEFGVMVEEFRLIVVAERLSIPEPRQRQSSTPGT